MDNTQSALVEIAEIPFEVRCRFTGNLKFFREYMTDKEPLFTIEPTEKDLRISQACYDYLAEQEGSPKVQYDDCFLENDAIHSAFSMKIVEYRTLLIHGSALCMDGEAYIFVADSGTGKSTHSKLWREAFGDRVWMINDDKPVLKITDNGVTAYGTPWNGKHRLGRNASAPVKAIVSLNRGAENRIEPMSKTDAFRLLLKHAHTSRKVEWMNTILSMDKQLVDNVAWYRLFCNMEPEAAIIAWKGMNKGIPCV